MRTPRALEPWEPELGFLAPELLGGLVPLSQRILEAVGALRMSSEQRSDQPNGYSSLARRGPYDRLLISEWAMQLENEDEFARRASMGEHLFLELDRRSPAQARETWLLLDSGPAQLGAPRIAQLATVIAFHRRAREANVPLKWAPLWSFELPPWERFDAETVKAWLNARTGHDVTPAVISQWLSRWPGGDGVEREVWLVGGPSLPMDDTTCGVIRIDDAEPDQLTVSVQPLKSRRVRTLSLKLPSPVDQVRLLRSPFPLPKVSHIRVGRELPLHPKTELLFSDDGHRLLARGAQGAVIALPMRNSSRAGYGWPSVSAMPMGESLGAVRWVSRRLRQLVLVNVQSGASRIASWDGATFSHRPGLSRPLEPWGLELFGYAERETEQRATDDGDRLARSLHRTRTAEVRRADGGGAVAIASSTSQRTLLVPDAQGAFVNWDREFVALVHTSREWLAINVGDGPTSTNTRSLPHSMFIERRVIAVTSNRFPVGMVVWATSGNTVWTMDTEEGDRPWKEVVRARGSIEDTAMTGDGRLIAWRDSSGEIGVWSAEREEVVLRVSVKDASKDLA